MRYAFIMVLVILSGCGSDPVQLIGEYSVRASMQEKTCLAQGEILDTTMYDHGEWSISATDDGFAFSKGSWFLESTDGVWFTRTIVSGPNLVCYQETYNITFVLTPTEDGFTGTYIKDYYGNHCIVDYIEGRPIHRDVYCLRRWFFVGTEK